MAKRDRSQPVEENEKEKNTAPQEEPTKTPDEAAETFTVTREQMEQLENLAATMEAEKDKYLRLAAEYDNYRKRTAREKESTYADAKTNTVREFLAVYDNLERGVSQYEADSPHRQGVEMIFKQFKEILAKLGVAEMDALGKPFDPELHNAVMHIEDPELGENVITEVFQQGFMLGGKVLRVAIVKVAN